MTKSEKMAADRLIAQGHYLINSGWPDFLTIKDGEVKFWEIKSGTDSIRPNQKECHEILRKLGFVVEVVRISLPSDANIRENRAIANATKFLKEHILVPMYVEEFTDFAAKHGIRVEGANWYWRPRSKEEAANWNTFEKQLETV